MKTKDTPGFGLAPVKQQGATVSYTGSADSTEPLDLADRHNEGDIEIIDGELCVWYDSGATYISIPLDRVKELLQSHANEPTVDEGE